MGLFHSGMNYWQRQALSDRIHKRGRYAPAPRPTSSIPSPEAIPSPPEQRTSPRKQKPSSAEPVTKSVKSAPVSWTKRLTKITWPDKEHLAKLLWEKPTVQIAAELGVSETAVKKHCRLLGIEKPPRGYWAKQAKTS